jgi:hypothetical protein
VHFYLRFDAFVLEVVSVLHSCTNRVLKRIWLLILPTDFIRFEVLMMVNIKTGVFWDVTPCILVCIYLRFGGIYWIFSPILKMDILKE